MACLCRCFYLRRAATKCSTEKETLSSKNSSRDNFATHKFKVIPPVQFEPREVETPTEAGVGSGNNNDGGGGSDGNIWKKITRNVLCVSAAT